MQQRIIVLKAAACLKGFVLLTLLSIILCGNLTAQHDGIIGEKAPPFDYEQALDLKGNETSLSFSQFKGKVTIILFWQYTCELCLEKSIPALKKMYEQNAENSEVAFLAVQTTGEKYYINNFEKLTLVREDFDLPIYYAYDPGDLKMEHEPPSLIKFKASSMPWFVIIDKTGKVAFNDLHLSPTIGNMAIKSLL